MSAHIVVFTTTASVEEGQSIAQALVEERLAACVNILSPVRSVYRWEGKLQSGEEALLMVKTTALRLEQLSLRIQQLHSYEVPEIIAVPLVGGGAAYLDWIDAQTSTETLAEAPSIATG